MRNACGLIFNPKKFSRLRSVVLESFGSWFTRRENKNERHFAIKVFIPYFLILRDRVCSR